MTSSRLAVMSARQPDLIDHLVGQNIRFFRCAARMSLEELGAILGVSYQQIHKYENAMNRISASRLFIVSKALHRTIDEFFAIRDFSL
jgi:transcriptional regulator with XRE-family HTH domain